MDDIKNGQRINCNGVHGTVIGKRSTRNQRFVLVKMENGFTLKLKADTLSVELPEMSRQRREENFSDPAVTGTSNTEISADIIQKMPRVKLIRAQRWRRIFLPRTQQFDGNFLRVHAAVFPERF